MHIWKACLLLPFRLGSYCSPVPANQFLGREVHQRAATKGGRHLRGIRRHPGVLFCRRQVQQLQVVRQSEPFWLYKLTMPCSEWAQNPPSIGTQVRLTQRDRAKLRSTRAEWTTRPTGAGSAPLIRSVATRERGTNEADESSPILGWGFTNSEQQVRVGDLTR